MRRSYIWLHELCEVLALKVSLQLDEESSKMPFYAVRKGRQTGVFKSWPECQEQVKDFPYPAFKKFPTEKEAWEFVRKENTPIKKISSCSYSGASNLISNVTISESGIAQELSLLTSSLNVLKTSIQDFCRQKEMEIDNIQRSIVNLTSRSEGGSSTLQTVQASPSATQPSERKRKVSNSSSIEAKMARLNEESLTFDLPFQIDDDGFVHCYTDGACENNGRNGAKAGIGVWFADNHPLNASEPVAGRPTNNTAEIQAATYAVELAKAAGIEKLVVNTDSEFLINCITKWIKTWKKNGWHLSSGGDVKNREDLEDLDRAIQTINVKWNHVRGHCGIHGNEAADELARKGAEQYARKV